MTSVTFVSVFRGSTPQTIPDATWTTVLYNVVETDGTSNTIYDPTTGRFSAPVAGWYDIEAQIQWTAAAGAAPAIRIVKNGDTNLPAFVRSGDATSILLNIKLRLFLGRGEFVEVQVIQNSGGGLDILEVLDPQTQGEPGRCSSGNLTLIKESPSVTFTTF